MKANPIAWLGEAGEGATRARPLIALVLMTTALQAGAQQPTQAAAQGEIPAVLKLQEVDFFYRSSVAPLSCTHIQGRVASVLRALGARDDVNVEVIGCDAVVDPLERSGSDPTFQTGGDRWRAGASMDPWSSSSDPWSGSSNQFGDRRSRREQSTRVRVRAMMPVEVTPEVLDEIKKDRSRRELISRVTGNPAASMNEPIVFPAQRQLVTLSRRNIDLEPEECQLLEQMSTGIFRQLGLRPIRGGARCDRNEISRLPPQLTVEALMPIMPSTPQLTLPPGESDPDPGAPTGSASDRSQPATEPPQR